MPPLKPFDIVSLGEPMYEFSQIPGEERRYLQGFGGDTSNCAIAAARQGAKVAYITRLGEDEFGRQFRDLWRAEGIDTSGAGVDAEAHTAVYFITHGAQGHEFSYLRAGSAASRMQPQHLPHALLRETRFFHTSGITQAISTSACDTAFAAIDLAKTAGAQFVYDANLRPRLWPLARARAVIAATIRLSDVFLLSTEDGEFLTGSSDAEKIIDWSHARGARTVVLKLGARGALASDGARRESVLGHRVDCVDATGAGDCFAGALMARLARGDDLATALRYANAAAALTTTGYGAVAPLPRPQHVQSLLETSTS
jgi:2-dehydro-3-deoxygluconokinase